MYDLSESTMIQKLDDLSQGNYQANKIKYNKHTESVEDLINIQGKIASYFIGFWKSSHLIVRNHVELMPMLLATFHRNFFLFFSAYKLTIQGLYGPARPLMRYIFESLMISKFCYLSDNPNVLVKWDSGDTIYFSNAVLKKIIKPDPKPFSTFWGIICDQSHANKNSMQFTLELDDEDEPSNTAGNLAILALLLECNYHLLNSMLITPELYNMAKHYASRYVFKEDKYGIPVLREKAHLIFKQNRSFLSPDSISLISAYKRRWDLKV